MGVTSTGQDLLDELAGHLISIGAARAPETADPTNQLHPVFKDPRLGPIAPKFDVRGADGDPNLVLSLVPQTPIRQGPYESWTQRPCVDFYIRSTRSPDIQPMAERLRLEFDDRRDWTTATGMYVIESGVWTELARIGSDESTFTSVIGFWFQIYTARAPRDG